MASKARIEAIPRDHVRARFLALFCLSLVFVGCTRSHTLVVKTAPSVGIDSLLNRIATVAAEGAPQTAGVWPGYRVPTEYIICRHNRQTLEVTQTLVVTTSPLPKEFGQPLRVSSSQATETTNYFFAEPLPDLGFACFDLEYPVGAKKIVAVPQADSVYSIKDPVVATVAVLYHEAFHAYQGRHFSPTHGGARYEPHQEPMIPLEIIRSPEFQRLAGSERTLLADALTITNVDSLRPLLRAYLAVRWKRMQLLPTQYRSAEPHNERKEGSANLVGYETAYFASQGSAEGVAELVRADLLATPAFDGEQYMSNGYRQWHIYATGAAIGLLLDRMNVQWREKMQAGSTFEALLRDAVSFSPNG